MRSITIQEQNLFKALREARIKANEVFNQRAFRGVKPNVVDKYAETAHFVYELLQNADDANATKVTIILKPDRLIFKHNGTKHFDITSEDDERVGDINSITGIGNSSKENTQNKIGKFGVGSALEETIEIMKNNNTYFGKFSSAPVLGYISIDFLPKLEELLIIALKMEEKFTNWSGVIVNAMKNIAMGSEENTNKVCKLLSQYTATDKWLNRIIIEIQSEYYELHYKKLSIKDAVCLAINC